MLLFSFCKGESDFEYLIMENESRSIAQKNFLSPIDYNEILDAAIDFLIDEDLLDQARLKYVTALRVVGDQLVEIDRESMDTIIWNHETREDLMLSIVRVDEEMTEVTFRCDQAATEYKGSVILYRENLSWVRGSLHYVSAIE